MSEEEKPKSAENKIPGVDFAVPYDDLKKSAPDSIIEGKECDSYYKISTIIAQTIDHASSNIRSPLMIFYFLTEAYIDADDGVQPFKPMWQMGGERPIVPSDFCAEQFDELRMYAPEIKNSLLRARVSDAVWNSNKSHPEMGKIAIDAYCDLIESAEAEKEELFKNEHFDFLKRACFIAHAMKWNFTEAKRLRKLIARLTEFAFTSTDGHSYYSIARIALAHGIVDATKIADWAEALTKDDRIDYFSIEWLWDIVAQANYNARNKENEKRALRKKAEHYEYWALNHCQSVMQSLAFFDKAISTIKDVPEFADYKKKLNELLVGHQSKIVDELGAIPLKFNLSKWIPETLKLIEGATLHQRIKILFSGNFSDPKKFRDEMLKRFDGTPMRLIIPRKIMDSNGKTKLQTKGYDHTNPESEENETHLLCLEEEERGIMRTGFVNGHIDPIRQTIMLENTVSEKMLTFLFAHSPFVPPDHESIFAKGAMAFFRRDDLAAIQVLVFQLENSLRYILKNCGVDTTKHHDDGTQEDATLTTLLTKYRGDLAKILPTSLLHEIDLLFIFPGGPMVRNNAAHGKLSIKDYWQPTNIYAAWFVIFLALCPLYRHWDKLEV